METSSALWSDADWEQWRKQRGIRDWKYAPWLSNEAHVASAIRLMRKTDGDLRFEHDAAISDEWRAKCAAEMARREALS